LVTSEIIFLIDQSAMSLLSHKVSQVPKDFQIFVWIALIYKRTSVLIIIRSGNVNTGPVIFVIRGNLFDPVDFNISRSTVVMHIIIQGWFFQLFNWFQLFSSWQRYSESCRTWSEQLKKEPFERGCRWLQLFSLIFSYFIF